MMVREIITPTNSVFTMRLPDEMMGKTVEVIAFEIEVPDSSKRITPKEQKLKWIDELTAPTLIDLSKFKFNREDANNYE